LRRTIRFRAGQWGATIRWVRDCDVAQAAELVGALRDQLREMTTKLAWVERQGVTGRNGRACAMRLEAAALRRDIKKAQVLIDRLQRRFLSGDAGPPPEGVGLPASRPALGRQKEATQKR
jgi:hypothetical protein